MTPSSSALPSALSLLESVIAEVNLEATPRLHFVPGNPAGLDDREIADAIGTPTVHGLLSIGPMDAEVSILVPDACPDGLLLLTWTLPAPIEMPQEPREIFNLLSCTTLAASFILSPGHDEDGGDAILVMGIHCSIPIRCLTQRTLSFLINSLFRSAMAAMTCVKSDFATEAWDGHDA